ncbi:hypothetical protein K8I28_11380 [bacterium]|nr:hypothetical protein [bacterium]
MKGLNMLPKYCGLLNSSILVILFLGCSLGEGTYHGTGEDEGELMWFRIVKKKNVGNEVEYTWNARFTNRATDTLLFKKKSMEIATLFPNFAVNAYNHMNERISPSGSSYSVIACKSGTHRFQFNQNLILNDSNLSETQKTALMQSVSNLSNSELYYVILPDQYIDIVGLVNYKENVISYIDHFEPSWNVERSSELKSRWHSYSRLVVH